VSSLKQFSLFREWAAFLYGSYARDYPTVMGILLIGAILTLFGNLIADVSYAVADPRIRIS